MERIVLQAARLHLCLYAFSGIQFKRIKEEGEKREKSQALPHKREGNHTRMSYSASCNDGRPKSSVVGSFGFGRLNTREVEQRGPTHLMPCRYAWCWLVPKCHASEKGPTLFSLHCKTGDAASYLSRLNTCAVHSMLSNHRLYERKIVSRYVLMNTYAQRCRAHRSTHTHTKARYPRTQSI